MCVRGFEPSVGGISRTCGQTVSADAHCASLHHFPRRFAFAYSFDRATSQHKDANHASKLCPTNTRGGFGAFRYSGHRWCRVRPPGRTGHGTSNDLAVRRGRRTLHSDVFSLSCFPWSRPLSLMLLTLFGKERAFHSYFTPRNIFKISRERIVPPPRRPAVSLRNSIKHRGLSPQSLLCNNDNI